MAVTLQATGPVVIENISLAKIQSVPFVSFDKEVELVVEINEENVTMTYDTKDELYKATVGPYRYRCEGPRWIAATPAE